jgi:hypothetical protein
VAPKKQLAIQALLLGWIAITIFGLYAGFTVANSWMDIAQWIAIALGVVFAIAWTVAYPLIFQGSVFRKSAVFLILMFWCLAMSCFGLLSGLPWLWTWVSGVDTNSSAVVHSKGDGRFRWRDYCTSHQIQFFVSKSGQVTRMCLNEGDWAKLEVGDHVQISLRQSSFGSYAYSIAIKP